MPVKNELRISSFLIKIASRCNIDCDYCYMYNHLNQDWKLQPKLMSEDIIEATSRRISEYVTDNNIDRIAIIYHGGEPLLFGAERIVANVQLMKSILPQTVLCDFCIQTNGTILTDADLRLFRKNGIGVSLSLDGPKSAQDRHRNNHNGTSTYQEVEKALTLLESYQDIFSGVIAVIDVNNDPEELLSFFSSKAIPQIDFLLPDANYINPPIGKEKDINVYEDWLINCFDIWFDAYSELKIRTFDTILASLYGLPSETDGLGLGDVSLISIETNGSYHDLDVLKITGVETSLIGDVFSTSIAEAIKAPAIATHRSLLQKEGLSVKCQLCSIVDICGGGAVPHRYSLEGFKNPSIYCKELKSLILFAKNKIEQLLQNETDKKSLKIKNVTLNEISEFEVSKKTSPAFQKIVSLFQDSQLRKLKFVLENITISSLQNEIKYILSLPNNLLLKLAIYPSVVAWTDVIEKGFSNIVVLNIDGNIIDNDQFHLLNFREIIKLIDSQWPSLHSEDKWLRAPFGNSIYFENNILVTQKLDVIYSALSLIKDWNPDILNEMQLISPEIQFIRDPTAHIDKVVSFSDNSVPGALYVQLTLSSSGAIHPSDLADSIIHEHRHQKLYLLQRECDLVTSDVPLIKSPWREELRPPTGLFHAIYVFVELFSFWTHLHKTNNISLINKSYSECLRIREQLKSGFEVIKNCNLTLEGHYLLDILISKFESSKNEFENSIQVIAQ